MLQFTPFERVHAEIILSWRYPPPYDLYNESSPEPEAVEALLQSELPHLAVLDENDVMIAFCCFGADARVPGGMYPEDALDMGGGLRPDLTGQGLGHHVIAAAMAYAIPQFRPQYFRTTVASFNQRAQKTCRRLGYQTVRTFTRTSDGTDFEIMLMKAIKPRLTIPFVIAKHLSS